MEELKAMADLSFFMYAQIAAIVFDLAKEKQGEADWFMRKDGSDFPSVKRLEGSWGKNILHPYFFFFNLYQNDEFKTLSL